MHSSRDGHWRRDAAWPVQAMSPGPTFDRVYLWLKEQLIAGALPPGSALEPSHLSDALATSITPIRDALHRLAGERLVDASWGEGFRVPAPTEAELRGLYAWHYMLLDLALRASNPIRPIVGSADELKLIADIALRIARRGGAEQIASVASVGDRLGAPRAAEIKLFADTDQEIDLLRALILNDDVRGLKKTLGAYHRRRMRAVPDIVLAMRSLAV